MNDGSKGFCNRLSVEGVVPAEVVSCEFVMVNKTDDEPPDSKDPFEKVKTG